MGPGEVLRYGSARANDACIDVATALVGVATVLKRHARAQLVAMLAFSAMYFGAVAATIHWSTLGAGDAWLLLLLNIDAYSASIVAGFLAAAMTRKKGIATGALTGILAACLVGIYHLSSGPQTAVSSGWQFWLTSVLFGGLGGLIWHLRNLAKRPA